MSEKLTLTGVYAEIAALFEEEMGERVALKLMEHFGGQHLYLPTRKSALQALRDEKIRREFTGTNHKTLARRYGLSEQRIRDIVGPASRRASGAPEGQLKLY